MNKLKYTIGLLIIFIICTISVLFLMKTESNAATTVTQTTSTSISGISNSDYPGVKSMIQALQKAHPNWTFKVVYTGLDWSDVISAEAETTKCSNSSFSPKSLTSRSKWVCSTCGTKGYSGSSWYHASTTAIKYMMDPRNSLYYDDVFQFLELSYDSSTTYSKSAIKEILEDTFLDDGNLDTYVSQIMTSSKKYGVNPYYVTAKIIQEQGTSGGSTWKMEGTSDDGEYVLDDDNNALIVLAGTTVSDISTYLGSSTTVKNSSGSKISSSSSIVATGYTAGSYTIVVRGDVNGDGKVKATDYVKVKNYILGTTKLSTYQKLAADVNDDGKVKSTDYVKIKNNIMGKSSITLSGTTYYYNIFNIGASGSTSAKILANALAKAQSYGWTSIESCIDGSIEFMADGYIDIGQNTLYFEKYDVVNTSPSSSYYTHQYAQDIMYAQNQGEKLLSILESIDAVDYSYTFIIPLYENMPSSACAVP